MYNVNAAIEIRSEGIFDDAKGFQVPVNFKTSVELAKDYNFMWGWSYPGEVWFQVQNSRKSGNEVTKETWKRWSREYRLYLRNSNEQFC